MSEENKRLARDFIKECLNEDNLDAVERYIAPDFVDHMLPDRDGIEGVCRAFREFKAAFPDLHDTLEDVIADGDRVVLRYRMDGTHEGEFLGVPPTGKKVTWTGVNVTRVADGKFVERWGAFDVQALLEQLGAWPVKG